MFLSTSTVLSCHVSYESAIKDPDNNTMRYEIRIISVTYLRATVWRHSSLLGTILGAILVAHQLDEIHCTLLYVFTIHIKYIGLLEQLIIGWWCKNGCNWYTKCSFMIPPIVDSVNTTWSWWLQILGAPNEQFVRNGWKVSVTMI